jgi:hypothetical protein
MAVIDQSKTFQAIERRIARTTNPRHLLMLERLLIHAKGEAIANLDMVMSTLSSNPVYHSWNAPPALSPNGRNAVYKFYVEQVVEAGLYFFEFDIDRMVVDDDTIVTEGILKTLYIGSDAQAMGLPVDNPNGFYVVKNRMMIVWPYDADGFITGEDSYAAPLPDFITEAPADQIPQAFKDFLAARSARTRMAPEFS